MFVNLITGQEYSLTKENPSLEKIFVGLGWDVSDDAQSVYDLDASAFLLDATGRVSAAPDFIYYNNLEHPSGAVVHTGDNRTGEGEGDDEAITVDLAAVPENIEKILFTVSIYEADERGQTFGQVKNAYIRFYDEEEGELFRFDLGEDFSNETAVVFGELYKKDGEWKFNALGQGYQGGLVSLSLRYGVFKKK